MPSAASRTTQVTVAVRNTFMLILPKPKNFWIGFCQRGWPGMVGEYREPEPNYGSLPSDGEAAIRDLCHPITFNEIVVKMRNGLHFMGGDLPFRRRILRNRSSRRMSCPIRSIQFAATTGQRCA